MWRFAIVIQCIVLFRGERMWADESMDREGFFEKRIRPILVEKCVVCHSKQTGKTSGGLALDTASGWKDGGDSGIEIVAGDAKSSLLYDRVATTDEELRMPPAEHGNPLTSSEQESIKIWIETGAFDPRESEFKIGGMTPAEAQSWWAFQPIGEQSDSRRRIDDFFEFSIFQNSEGTISATHQAVPAMSLDGRKLLRRVAYDLTGLPPDWNVVEAYGEKISDETLSGYVNRLLDSPEYGEHWGRHWLDVVRYADTAGENSDHPIPQMWKYRDWVFKSFQEDKSFDEFVQLQLAGDLIRSNELDMERYAEGIIATGYLSVSRRFGHDSDVDMHLTYEDTIDNLGKAFLGLSISCARCHDHKYDPITMKDYYSLVGMLQSSRYSFSGCEAKVQPRDLIELLSDRERARLFQPWMDRRKALEEQIEKLDREIAVMGASIAESIAKSELVEMRTVAENSSVPLGESDPAVESSPVRIVKEIKQDACLLLLIHNNGGHGADSTLVDVRIQELDRKGTSPMDLSPVKSTDGSDVRIWETRKLAASQLIQNPMRDELSSLQSVSTDVGESDIGNYRWGFLEVTPLNVRLLGERIPMVEGRNEIQSWRNKDTPSVFVNSSEREVNVWTALPSSSFFMHPGPESSVGLLWRAPRDGSYELSGSIRDVHPASLDGVRYELKLLNTNLQTMIQDWFDKEKKLQSLRVEIKELDLTKPRIPVAFGVVDRPECSDSPIHLRGDPSKKGEIVERRWIEILGGQKLQNSGSSGRRELAQWIANHPLAKRVYVNRIWQWHFGEGLVSTSNDFGSRGAGPRNLELLDFLVSEWERNQFSTKHLHRLILSSQIYRSAASYRVGLVTESTKTADSQEPAVAYPSRLRKLTAEELRDSLLCVSGRLIRGSGGEHPFPPVSMWNYSQHNPFNAVYDNDRRSCYQMITRQRRHPFFALFDGADPNSSTSVRQDTTVPTQSLYFMNDPFFHACAHDLAGQLAKLETEESKCNFLFQRVLQRNPSLSEFASVKEFMGNYAGSLEQKWDAIARVLLSSNEFLFVD